MKATVATADLIKVIGRAESSIAATYGEDTSGEEHLVRELRELVGLPKNAIVRWDDTQRRYTVIDAKKAVARARRKGTVTA